MNQVVFAGQTVLNGPTYDALGRATTLPWGNGLSTATTWGPNQKASQIKVGTLVELAYRYDPNGNTLSIGDTNPSASWTRTHTYDWADRLVSASQTGAYAKSWSWQYDAVGNMTYNSDWVSATGGTADASYYYGLQYTGEPAGPHAVTKIGQSGDGSPAYHLKYDANGALVWTNVGQSYTYNFDGRIATYKDTSADPDPNIAFEYDGNGDRIRKTWVPACGTTAEVRYFGPHYEEEWSGGALQYRVRYVMLGSTRLAMVSDQYASELRFLHPDVQGTIGVVTSPTGAEVLRRVYAPYGSPMADSGTLNLKYGYTGQEYDAEAGQMHLGVRQYDVAIARFPQPDSIVPDPLRPQSLNRYTYAANNPVRYSDPSGYAEGETVGKLHCGDLGRCDRFVQQLGEAVGGLPYRAYKAAIEKLSARAAELGESAGDAALALSGDPIIKSRFLCS